MDDVRWFASNTLTSLVVPEFRRAGLKVATNGHASARVTVAMSGRVAEPAWRYSRALGAPLVVYLWDLPPRRTGTGRYDPVWWVGGRFLRLPRLVGGYRHWAGHYSRLRYVAARADAVWAASAFTAGLVKERFGLESEVVPYCFDSTRFHPGSEPREVPPVLLTVSRLEGYKNQATVLHAAARFGGRVTVRIIGRGPKESALRELGRSLQVPVRIETDADDATVAVANRTASVAVCLSRFEGFGLSPIEALASGTPVVASDIPAHREYVGHTARLVSPEDPAAIADAVADALAAPAPDPSVVEGLRISAAAGRILARLAPLLR